MKTKLFTEFILITFCLTLLLMFLPAEPVRVAGDSLEGLDARLENMLMREKIALNNRSDLLACTDTIMARAEAIIQKMKGLGLDTQMLEQALADLQKGVQAAWDIDQAGPLRLRELRGPRQRWWIYPGCG